MSDNSGAEKLLPCPFCGAEPAKRDLDGIVEAANHERYMLACATCLIARSGNSWETAIERWNTRADRATATTAGDNAAAIRLLDEWLSCPESFDNAFNERLQQRIAENRLSDRTTTETGEACYEWFDKAGMLEDAISHLLELPTVPVGPATQAASEQGEVKVEQDGLQRRLSLAIEALRRDVDQPFHVGYNRGIDDALLAVDGVFAGSAPSPVVGNQVEQRLEKVALDGLANLYRAITGKECERQYALGMATSAVSVLLHERDSLRAQLAANQGDIEKLAKEAAKEIVGLDISGNLLTHVAIEPITAIITSTLQGSSLWRMGVERSATKAEDCGTEYEREGQYGTVNAYAQRVIASNEIASAIRSLLPPARLESKTEGKDDEK